jgi:hypothetical protein
MRASWDSLSIQQSICSEIERLRGTFTIQGCDTIIHGLDEFAVIPTLFNFLCRLVQMSVVWERFEAGDALFSEVERLSSTLTSQDATRFISG